MISTTLARAKNNLNELRLPLDVLAKLLSGMTARSVSASTLASAFRDAAQLSSEVEAELLTITCRLMEYKNAFHPLTLPKNAEELLQLLSPEVSASEVEVFIDKVFRRTK
jgi:hypothetical protein